MSKILLLLLLLPVFSCKRPQPQLPANKPANSDSEQIDMLAINRKLIAIEDSVLAVYVKNLNQPFVRDSLGYWYLLHSDSAGNEAISGNEFTVEYDVYSLYGELLAQETESIEAGKKQTAAAIEDVLKKMTAGAEATLVSPWYLAFGTHGDGKKIEPYQSVKIELQRIE